MRNTKFWLLAATAACIATGAHAQVALPAPSGPDQPDNAIHAAGASSIQTILVQSLNCIGVDNQLGKNDNTLTTIAPGLYSPTTPTATNPIFDCATQNIQPNFNAKYVATGSGTGRAFWRTFTNQLPGTASDNKNPFGTWNHVQFAMSDTPIPATDLTAYAAGPAASGTGAAIQFPLYVLPVALAYNPTYAKLNNGSAVVDLKFQVKSTFVTKGYDGNPNGGLRLTKNDYCNIFTGNLTNFNDARLKTRNGNQSLMDGADDLTRWNTTGVPIRLVGRLDNSGTTDIFTRHLAEVCGSQAGVTLNKFERAAEALPYFRAAGQPDLSSFASKTAYNPLSTAPTANTTNTVAYQSISGAVFASGVINTTQGSEATGKFLVANGSSSVRDAINFQTAPGANAGDISLNGKLGYIASDFIVPAPGASLFAAALQVGTAATYAQPNAANGTAALGTILPPQSIATSGAYNINDTREVLNDAGTVREKLDRANPQHWTKVLYRPFANSTDTTPSAVTLANPVKGYPITGTTQFLGYTCYATADTRFNIVEFLALQFGKITKTSTGAPISSNTFKGTGATSLGLIAKLNIAPLSAGFQNAINETFLKKSTQDGDPSAAVAKLGDRNLWIQDKLPTKAADVDNVANPLDPKSNPACTAGSGA